MTAYNNLVKRWGMKFSEFCDNNMQCGSQNAKKNEVDQSENLNKNTEKFNKNCKNVQINSQNNQNFENFEISEDLKNKINTYQKMTEKEIQSELFKEVNKQKQNGTFSLQRIEDVKNKLSPMLTEEQRQKLDGLIKMLR